MGKKYIIELEDKPFHNGNGDFLYRVKGFNSLVFDMTGVGKLTPYTEPDLEQVRKEAYDKCRGDVEMLAHKLYSPKIDGAYQRGLNDAWEAARKICLNECDGGMSATEVNNIFKVGFYRDALLRYSASEAIEKIRQYEQPVTTEDVMRQYLDTFCRGRSCNDCPLNTPDFTCGRGYHFLTAEPVSDEEVRRAYAKVCKR